MTNQRNLPEHIKKKFRKKKPSLFPFPFNFPLPLKEKIEVPTLRFIDNKNKATKICSHCQEHKTSHRCPICAEPTCSNCKTYDDFQMLIPNILVRFGTCKDCKEELIDYQTLMSLKAFPQIVEQLSEHIKRFLEKFGIEFNWFYLHVETIQFPRRRLFS